MILKGHLVVELASVLAGPAVGMWLAELGARVIKVEFHLKGGDITRAWKLPSEDLSEDRSAYFSAVNWGKESIGLDLRSQEGKEVVYRLVEKADIVLASYKPGDGKKLGMDAETLMMLNPKLIYASLTAYGPHDPRAGFDAVIQAETGFTFMNGSSESGPVKMPVALMDVLAAHHLKEGVLLALLERVHTGKGRHVSTSLYQAGIASLANQATNWLVAGHIPKPTGSDHPNIVPYGTIFYCLENEGIVLAVGNDWQFKRLCEVLGHSEWVSDDRFQKAASRVRFRDEIKLLLQGVIGKWNRDKLLTELNLQKVPAGAVKNMKEVFGEDGARKMLFEKVGWKGVRSLALQGIGEPLPLSKPPHLGNAGKSILKEVIGYDEVQIMQLKKDGILC